MIKNIPFHPIITNWFSREFHNPSPPQEQGWPEIAKGNHTLIFAPTGSGKTLAAFLWCIDDLFRTGIITDNDLFEQNPFGVHTLYVSPLKALNNDIQRNLEFPLEGIKKLAKKSAIEPPPIRSLVRTGDTPSHVRQSMVKKPPHILITTPESLYLLLTSERGREIFRRLKYLIIDEIHAVSNNKRGVHLSLSVEWMMNLCQTEPVRIGLSATQKPLRRIAAYLGGQVNSKPRRVSIIDCGLKKDMDIKIISPVPDFSDLPESSVWPAVYKQLYELICIHKTTLIFANMRAHTEKIARKINELHQQKTGHEEEEIAYAHHGSMSRETRFDIEERLKKGEIPAVVATASLELGIDIGSIDLVVNLEAPRSVSATLQRIGRSGHLLSAKSKGRIIPLYPSDLDDALALTQAMQEGKIEESTIPENCLDVLAQQIVAEVSMQKWSRSELFNLVKNSYCYRNLSEAAFNKVVEMLTGRYAESKLPSLQPRITWDKVNDQLIARKGSRITAVMNGGTIPDRGYYTVYLADSNVRLGEMEEEFVFESKIGDVFFLGNNEWRIDSIEQDRIVVTPMTVVQPRAPFWKGEIPYRGYAVSEMIGRFREKFCLTDNILEWLKNEFSADETIFANTIKYLEKQKDSTGSLPTHRHIIFEVFRDTAEEYNLVIHAPLGARVNAPWAIALSSALEKKLNIEVQYSFDDDGILIRLRETIEELPLQFLQKLQVKEIEKLVIDSLTSSPLFAIQFRYNAARALLLPRSQPKKRIPLWLQRLRAADLLQVVKKYPEFPIIAETYRTCLQDVFDLKNLLSVISDISKGNIKISTVNTSYPSPMAAGLIFNFVSNQVYELDRSRAPADAASISSELLADILNRQKIPAIVTKEIVEERKQYWQHLSENNKASSVEDLFEIIEKLGPIDTEELKKRSKQNPDFWLNELQKNNRIIQLKKWDNGWVIQSNSNIFTSPESIENITKQIRYLFQADGPLSKTEIYQRFPYDKQKIDDALFAMLENNELVKGSLLKDNPEELWCDRNNFAELYRKAVSLRRKSMVAVDQNNYIKFLLNWHQFNNSILSVGDIIEKYRGVCFNENIFEREILRARFSFGKNEALNNAVTEFYNLISRGEIIVHCQKDGSNEFRFIPRSQGNLFKISIHDSIDKSAEFVYNFLKENGASLFDDIVNGTDLSSVQIQKSLKFLLEAGQVTCDDFASLKYILNQEKISRLTSQKKIPTRSSVKKQVLERIKIKTGRWFLTESFAVQGKQLNEKQRIDRQTRLLLDRYGILVKELYRREKNLLPWYQIFQTLKRLEWQGEVRRGYFIDGLSGLQFALPEAVELLENMYNDQYSIEISLLISTIDPALPFGGNVPWNMLDLTGEEIPVTRSAANHILFQNGVPIIYSENFASRLWFLQNFKKDFIEEIINQIKSWLFLPQDLRPRKKIEIQQINNKPVISSEYSLRFLENGFEKNGEILEIWPSGL